MKARVRTTETGGISPLRRAGRRFFSSQYVAFIFMAPWIIGLLVFFAYPFCSSVTLSFSKITSLFGYKFGWVGLENYQRLFFEDVRFLPLLLQSLRQTVIHVPCIVILSMILAVFLNTKLRLRGVLRSVYFLPVLLGTGYVMTQLLGQSGATSGTESLSRGLEIPPGLLELFSGRTLSVIKVVFDNITMILWGCGVQILIFLSGLQAISPALYESARVDGATEWEMYWKITLPMLAPVTVMTIIYTIISTFTNLSNPVIDYMLEVGKDLRSAGLAAAMGWVYLALVLVIVVIVLAFSRHKTDGVYMR